MDRGSLLHPQRDPARAWRPGADLHRFGRRSAVECASVDGHVVGGNSVHTAFKAKPPDASDGFEAGIGEQSSRASTKATRRGPGPARDGVRGGAAASSPRTRMRILHRPGGRRARRRQLPRRAGPGRWKQLGNTTPGDSRKPEGGEDGDLPVNQAAPAEGRKRRSLLIIRQTEVRILPGPSPESPAQSEILRHPVPSLWRRDQPIGQHRPAASRAEIAK